MSGTGRQAVGASQIAGARRNSRPASWLLQAAAPAPAAGGGRAGPAGLQMATVQHMFVADYNQPEELSVFEGDRVEILEESDGWMLVKDPSGNQGLVPTSYLQLDPPPAGGTARPRRSSSVSHSREPTAFDLSYEGGGGAAPAAAAAEEARPAARGRGHARMGERLRPAHFEFERLNVALHAGPLWLPAAHLRLL